MPVPSEGTCTLISKAAHGSMLRVPTCGAAGIPWIPLSQRYPRDNYAVPPLPERFGVRVTGVSLTGWALRQHTLSCS